MFDKMEVDNMTVDTLKVDNLAFGNLEVDKMTYHPQTVSGETAAATASSNRYKCMLLHLNIVIQVTGSRNVREDAKISTFYNRVYNTY
jgi:hypothetical protein